MDLLTGFLAWIVLQTSLQVGLQFHFVQDFCQMKTVLMHSYGDENVHVTGKRFWESVFLFHGAIYKIVLLVS